MFKFIERLFNGSNEREIKKMRRVVEEQINPLEASLKNLSDASLAHKTVEFKNRLANGCLLYTSQRTLLWLCW